MGDTPVPETIENESDEANARTVKDHAEEQPRPEGPDAHNPVPSFPDVLAAFQKTSPIVRRDLPETTEYPPGEPVPPDGGSAPNEPNTLPEEAAASAGTSSTPAKPAARENSIPQRIGRFPVEKLLGTGNFGNVYLARDLQLDLLVAIKVPRPDRFPDREYYDTFLHEARVAAQINHSGIVRVFQVDRDPEVGSFVVLEFIDGVSLAKLLEREQLTATRAVEMLRLIAVALATAHELGLVHRDLKPENILLDKSNRPHIADFGLAIREDDRWPSRWQVAGTPHYMAPEQVRGESHRLDGRTDLWALGVILYRMLTGVQPFEGKTRDEIFDGVLYREPVPPRQRFRNIPRALERICLKCLSKRMTDRFTSAHDLVEELDEWLVSRGLDEQTTQSGLTTPGEATRTARDPDTEESPARPRVRVRPKGLRAFDADDADYFLRLLPGPRDRNDLPESIRFWKTRIEPGKRDDPFAVGLLCGPSGSGKTSLVRAGLLRQLDPNLVLHVYVEATPETTEARLLAALERVTSGPGARRSLALSIAGIRNRTLLSPGPKVLIVLDQFEQWLLADHEPSGVAEQLVAALRQCDGFNVQCLILVRDDFGMAAARFMRSLEIRLIESHNFATVEPFDPVHARKVLREFGLAYDRFRDDEVGPHERFLDQAVDELAQDGKIAPVRLALLAQMIKDKPWTPATLKEVGGLEGIGRTFLEESLAGPLANPEHKLHLAAARRVLQALLPSGAADIRGHMRSYSELLEASGYARKPGDFDTLLAILGTELRLITPTDPHVPDPSDLDPPSHRGDRYYHLTHDYLVPSLREWLRQKDIETIAGRAAIRLSERTAEWTARRSRRYLPSCWEWLVMLLFTRRSRRSPAEKRMIRAASLYHSARLAAVAALVVLICVVADDWLGRERARSLVHVLETAQPKNVQQTLASIAPYRRWAVPILRGNIAGDTADERSKTRMRLALLPVDGAQANELLGPLLLDEPADFLAIRQVLREHGNREELEAAIRRVLRNEREYPDRRLRAGMALAGLLGETQAAQDADLAASARFLAEHFVGDLSAHPERYNDWLEALRPVRVLLMPPLGTIFRRVSQRDSAPLWAATILANYAENDPAALSDLLLDADSTQFPVMLRALARFRTSVAQQYRELIKKPPPNDFGPEAKLLASRRQACAAIALLHWGDSETLWPLLRHTPDPMLRTYLIDRLSLLAPDPAALAHRAIANDDDVSVRRAVILALGGMPADQRTGPGPDRRTEPPGTFPRGSRSRRPFGNRMGFAQMGARRQARRASRAPCHRHYGRPPRLVPYPERTPHDGPRAARTLPDGLRRARARP